MIRSADPVRDAAACAAIYVPSVEGPASFEEVPPDADEMARRMRAMHEWLVAERDGRVVGYAYAGRFHERVAYRWSTATSIFVAPDQQRQGIGRALYGTLLPRLTERGFTSAMAGITLPNDASVALHESFGFERVALYRNIGYKAGAWRDVAWFQCPLAPRTDPPNDVV